MKECSKCLESKPLSAFSVNRSRPSGLENVCRDCLSGRRREARNRNPETYREQVRRSKHQTPYMRRVRHLWRTYRLTLEEYERLEDSTLGVCPICEERLVEVVDHDHTSGKVRGLLCQLCNRGLGHFGDSPERLQKALDYLLTQAD